MKFQVTYHIELEADTPEAAALETDRLIQTTRPRDFQVTAPRSGTVWIRVERGRAERVA